MLKSILYSLEPNLSVQEFREILVTSSLGERRPIHDLQRLERMLRHADLIVTARDGTRLVGLARAITDFSYCCYLSDLMVDVDYQSQGIGSRLISEIRVRTGDAVTLVAIAAPSAAAYYSKVGMKQMTNCWVIPRSC